MIQSKIVKCPICGEPYYYIYGKENADVCPDCKEKAEAKRNRELNKPKQI